MIGLNIIRKYGEYVGFELSNVDSFFFKLRDKLNVSVHWIKYSTELEIGNVYNKGK